MSTREEEKRSARPEKQASNKPDSSGLPTTGNNERIQPSRDPAMLSNTTRISIANSETRHGGDEVVGVGHRRHCDRALARTRAALDHSTHLPTRRHYPEGTRDRTRHATRHDGQPLPATRHPAGLPRRTLNLIRPERLDLSLIHI